MSGRKTTCEECCSLNINFLLRNGCLCAGRTAELRWNKSGYLMGSICLQCKTSDRLVLSYTREGTAFEQDVWLLWSPCRYGGKRPWFICPRCSEPKGVLYKAGAIFACRTCSSLCYGSQLDQCQGQGVAYKLRRRLGGQRGNDEIPKPKGMHWKTYRRICDQIKKADARSDAKLAWAISQWL